MGNNNSKKNDKYSAARQRVTKLLTGSGYFENATEFYDRLSSFEDIESLILKQAPVMMDRGQFVLLQNLINTLPGEHHSPWILYWSATASLPIDPQSAKHGYEAALAGFEKTQDSSGIFISWAGIVDSFIFAWDDFRPLDQWIKWMQDFLQKNPAFPSDEIEAQVVSAMFCSLMYRQPQHAELPVWAQRLERMLPHFPDKNRRLAMATHYALYLAWMGEFESFTALIERLKPSATIDNIQPVNLIAWFQTEAMHYWLNTNFEESQQSVQNGLRLADETGLHLWDFILRVQDAYLALESSNPDQWQNYLQKVRDIMDENGGLHQAHYYYLAALEALLQKNHQRALVHIKKSLQATIELGTPYPEALNCIAMGRVQIELAEYEKAETWLTKASTLAEPINSRFLHFNLYLSQAELGYAREDNKAGVTALRQAMVIGRQKNYFNTDWWRPYVMCGLCIKALENNIEVDYVQQLIKKRRLNPDSPPFYLDNWPWRIRIYTLGRFSVLRDGKPVSVNGKSKNKPIELLKALIAMGGRDVSETRICEALWPDAEGDNAHSSFTSTLLRLRQLLGSNLLLVHNAQLSLNDHLCWLDIWAYERSLGELESALSNRETQQLIIIEQKIQRVFDLYHGFFMEKEAQPGWMLPQRERLQTKLLRMIKRLIRFYSSRGRCKKVIALYEKAQELDPLSEEYYRGLMRCHAALGNAGEALAIYKSCQSILNVTFGIKPSDKTRQLFKLIKIGDKQQLKRACELCVQATG